MKIWLPTREELLRSAVKALDQGDAELARKLMDEAQSIPRQEPIPVPLPPAQEPRPLQPQPRQERSSGEGGAAIFAVILLILIVFGAIVFAPTIFQSATQLSHDVRKVVNPPRAIVVSFKVDSHVALFDVYVTTTLTLRNEGGSGYITVEYYGDSSGLLARKTYYMQSGETQTSREKLDTTINDQRVSYRIVEQLAG